jgi:Cu/Ag efflux protein CusF
MNTIAKLTLAIALAVSSTSLSLLAHAQQTPDAQAQAAMSEGEIKKVDKDGGKLTIKHGELKNLGMPGMTMVFKVQDPAMLDKVKQGDKVRFTADKVGGALMVTALDVAK